MSTLKYMHTVWKTEGFSCSVQTWLFCDVGILSTWLHVQELIHKVHILTHKIMQPALARFLVQNVSKPIMEIQYQTKGITKS